MLATTLSAALIAYLSLGVVRFARRSVGYSHVRNTISELGERDASDQRAVALWLFLPVGLMALWVALLVVDTNLPLAVLAVCLAVGYLVTAAFPCDPGSPLSGSFRQVAHNLGGAVQYIGGGLALLALEERVAVFGPAGLVVLGCAFAISFLRRNSWRGIIQRVAEVLLFGCLLAGTWQAPMGAL